MLLTGEFTPIGMNQVSKNTELEKDAAIADFFIKAASLNNVTALSTPPSKPERSFNV